MPTRKRPWRPLCLLLAAALLAACTRQTPLKPVETRVLRVDWAALHLPRLDQDGLVVQGVVFTPAQWPLEASAKRLLSGDFVGVLDAFDLTFSPRSIPDGVLSDLYDLGYVPAYVRVENPTAEPRPFFPGLVGLEVDGTTTWPAAAPDQLPAEVTEFDEVALAKGVGLAVVLVVVLVVGGAGLGNLRDFNGVTPTTVEEHPLKPGERTLTSVLLRPRTFQPGQTQEGVLLFHVIKRAADWRSARLRQF